MGVIENAYAVLDALLPFQWLAHDFMKNALLTVLLVTPLFGLLGTMVVSNRMAFFSDSLGHGAFTGIALGVLFGAKEPLASLLVFSILFALLITYIKNQSRVSTDTVIGVFSSTAIALGLMVLSYGGGFNKFAAYLIGDLLSITPQEIELLAGVALCVGAVWVLLFNRLFLVSINPALAASRGVRALWIEAAFAVVLAVVVAVSIQWVGILIINSMLVLPAAAARNVARCVRQYHALSVLFALFSGVTGLLASYYADTAAGATIVLVAALVFFATFFVGKRMIR